jgi:hypothetical protein
MIPKSGNRFSEKIMLNQEATRHGTNMLMPGNGPGMTQISDNKISDA